MFAGVLIAAAVIISGYTGGGSGGQLAAGPDLEAAKNVAPVTAEDHVRGSASAPITVIEYSDFQCPYCGHFHPTLQQVMKDYNGKVKWVYRNLPLKQIHPEAEPAANAAECIAALGGNDAFWKAADAFFANQEGLGPSLYEKTATDAGVSLAAFRSCFSAKKYQSKIDADVENALASGGNGTPFTIIVAEGKDPQVVEGAQTYEYVKAAIDTLLK